MLMHRRMSTQPSQYYRRWDKPIDGETECILTYGRSQPYCTICNINIVVSPKAVKQHLKSKPHKLADRALTDYTNVMLELARFHEIDIVVSPEAVKQNLENNPYPLADKALLLQNTRRDLDRLRTGLSLVAIYEIITRCDSDVSGLYSHRVQTLNDTMNDFWRSYDAREAFMKTKNTLFTLAQTAEESDGHVAYLKLVLTTATGPSTVQEHKRKQMQFEQHKAEYHDAMARYRELAQTYFDTYTSQILGDKPAEVDQAYKRDFVTLIRSIIRCHTNNFDVERGVYSFMDRNFVPHPIQKPFMTLELLYTDITRDDSEVSGMYNLSVCTCDKWMKGFWYDYDAGHGSDRRRDTYHHTMEAYRKTAQDAFHDYRWKSVCKSDGAWYVPRNRYDYHERLVVVVEKNRKKATHAYKKIFAALIKSMVPYLESKKQEAFAGYNLKTDIHDLIHSFRATFPAPLPQSKIPQHDGSV